MFIKVQKRAMTLVEMMIVMFLIAMITGVIAYNYSGSLEEGKAFKTQAGIEKIHTILTLHLTTHPQSDLSNWEEIVKASPLVSNPEAIIKDGWGEIYNISFNNESDEIAISSRKYDTYLQGKGKGSMFKKQR